jgi:transmembrane sensor
MDEQFEHSVDFELLGRFFAGECTPEERARAESWIAASEENRSTYEALREIWDQAEDPEEVQEPDVEQAWNAVEQRLTQGKSGWRTYVFTFLRAAAAIVVGVGLSFLAYRFLAPGGQVEMVALTAGDQVLTDTLPDGSVVTLNAGSALRYPAEFAGDGREVELQGEAFFEVERNPARPFTVRAGKARVRVLGTSFSVHSQPASVEVVVATGKVELSSPDKASKQAVILEPGDRGEFRPEQGSIRKDKNADANFLYWKDRRLIFRNSPLNEVAEELQEVFGKEVNLASDKIANCPLSTTFDDLSIESILNIIAETFNLKVTQDGTSFTLQGEGC